MKLNKRAGMDERADKVERIISTNERYANTYWNTRVLHVGRQHVRAYFSHSLSTPLFLSSAKLTLSFPLPPRSPPPPPPLLLFLALLPDIARRLVSWPARLFSRIDSREVGESHVFRHIVFPVRVRIPRTFSCRSSGSRAVPDDLMRRSETRGRGREGI